jgi:hypothetical protein
MIVEIIIRSTSNKEWDIELKVDQYDEISRIDSVEINYPDGKRSYYSRKLKSLKVKSENRLIDLLNNSFSEEIELAILNKKRLYEF